MSSAVEKTGKVLNLLILPILIVNIVLTFLPGTGAHDLVFDEGYSMMMWGIIYFSFLVYCTFQLQPERNSEEIYGDLAKPLLTSFLLCTIWTITSRLGWVGISVGLTVPMLYFSVLLYIKVRNAVLAGEASGWLSVPFTLFSSWIFVTSISGISEVLISSGWIESTIVQYGLIAISIFGAVAATILVGYRCGDILFPMVVGFGCLAVFLTYSFQYPPVGVMTLVGSILSFAWGSITIARRIIYRHRSKVNKFYFDSTFRLKLNG